MTGLAEAVADGRTPDWDSAVRDASDDEERDAVVALRELAAIGELFATSGDRSRSSRRREVLAPGASWGHLRIVEHVGLGRFGDVYRAWDAALDRNVALKLIDCNDSEIGLDTRVVEEGRLMARVRHPNVVAIYGAQRIDGVTGLWMEFVEGRTLEAELADRGPFTADALVAVCRQLCHALTAVHDAGLAHRDVKASNVLRDQSGRVVLGDFGTGRELDDADGPLETLAGTPAYLAPEIFAHQPATPRSDLYSLGVLLFHLATGRYPVSGRSFRELEAAHDDGPASVVDYRSDLPVRLRAVIDRLLSADPARRYDSARMVESAVVPVTRRRPAAIAAACGTCTVIGLAAFVVWPRADSPPANTAPGTAVVADSGKALPSAPPATAAASDPPIPVPARGPDVPLVAPAQPTGLTLTHLNPDLQIQRRTIFRGASSPDGRLIGCQNSPPDVSVCDLVTEEVRILKPRHEGEQAFAGRSVLMSPDGRRIAYAWLSTPRGGVQVARLGVIDTGGQNDQELYRIQGGTGLALGSWTPDSTAIVASTAAPGTPGTQVLMLLPIAGEPKELWRFSPDDGVFDLSPDGRTLAITRPVTSTNQDLVAINLSTGKEIMLASGPVDDFWPLWTPDGKAIVFMSDRLGGYSLMLLKMTSGGGVGEPVVLRQFGRERTRPISFAPDGSLFVNITPAARTAFMTTIDIGRGIVGAAHAIDRSVIEDTLSPVWSPDGERIAYLRSRQPGRGGGTIVMRRTDIGEAHELPLPDWIPLTGSELRWSPDGKDIAMIYGGQVIGREAGYTIDILNASTGKRREVISGLGVGYPRWDPAGGGLYYRRGAIVFRYDLATSQHTQVYRLEPGSSFSEAGFDALPADGSLALAVRKPGMIGCILSILEPSGAFSERETFDGDCRAVAWTHSGHSILVSTVDSGARASLWKLDRLAGPPVRLPIEAPVFHTLSLSPDDSRLLFAAGNPRASQWKVTGIRTSTK